MSNVIWQQWWLLKIFHGKLQKPPQQNLLQHLSFLFFFNVDQICCKNVKCAPAFYVLYIPNLCVVPCMCVGFGYSVSLYLIEGESCLRSPLHCGSFWRIFKQLSWGIQGQIYMYLQNKYSIFLFLVAVGSLFLLNSPPKISP